MEQGTNRRVLISGCSGGGKSTLLAELARRGHAVVEEPGRRIVRQELEEGGPALPWRDMAAFLRRALDMAAADHRAAAGERRWTFFDRGVIDAASALQALTGEPLPTALDADHRYHDRVFLAPPWPEIHAADAERRHGFDEAVAEYERLACDIPALGYEVVLLPRTDVARRADFVLGHLRDSGVSGDR